MMLAVATLLSGCAPNGIYADEEPLLVFIHSVEIEHYSVILLGFRV